MKIHSELKDLLSERRKDCDILWVSRSMDPLLPHKLPAESRFSRKQAIEAVLNDQNVKLAIATLAAVKDVDANVVRKEAYTIVNKMASKAGLTTVRLLGLFITKVLKRIFSSIYINENVLYKLKKEMQISQVQYVYAPTHRSYLDFVLLSYILFSYDMALPNIASGMDFYQMTIIGELLRKTGAFYMRRNFNNDLLYKKVFRAYVLSLVNNSNRAIEFFIEGTRSRSLKSIVPKYGLLSIILESLLESNVPDIQFVPISISYERPPEELLFAYELLGVPKPKESMIALFRSLSILQKPSAYGRVFFNIAEPISACQFLTMKHRKARVLSPYANLPSNVTEQLAYSIIDSHKKHTVLIPFNLIALLFNERVQIHPDVPYTLDVLVEDYLWLKSVMNTFFNATVYTEEKSSFMNHDATSYAKQEILNSLKPHEELLAFDSSNLLRLKERHVTTTERDIPVKGHPLSEHTMRIAVSAINIGIYLNPVLSFFVKPAIATVAVGMDSIQLGTAFERYSFLRILLSTEFAMPLITNEAELKSEWNEVLDLLLKHEYFCIQNETYVQRQNLKLFCILYNVILPFIDAIYITCTVLLEWDDLIFSQPTTQAILAETQKRVEKAFLEGKSWGQHPYCLSLDLYSSTLSNLIAQGIVLQHGKQKTYQIDKIRLAQVLTQFENLFLKHPPQSYINLALLSTDLLVQAKL